MPSHPEHWSVAKRFSYEFGSTVNHLRKSHKAYCIGAGTFVLVVAVVAWARTDASTTDLPMILFASSIHLLRGMAIVSLLIAWLGAEFIQEWLYARISNAWVTKESSRRPGVSFQVPHWRFYIPTAIAHFTIFGVWLGSLFFLLYVVPSRVSGLERFIPDNFPF